MPLIRRYKVSEQQWQAAVTGAFAEDDARATATETLPGVPPGAGAAFRPTISGYRMVGPDWQVGPRRLADHLIYLVLDGAAVGEVAGKPMRLEPHSLLWLAPGVDHQFRVADRRRPVTLYHLRFRLTVGEADLFVAPRWSLIEDGREARHEIDAIVHELRSGEAHRLTRCRGLLAALTATLFRLRARAGRPPALDERQRRIVRQYVHDHLSGWPTPAELAEAVGLSHDYFTRLFRQTYGVPPRKWLMTERIRAAAAMLGESNLTVTEVSQRLGYENVFLFSRQFKQTIGRSPRAYRRSP